MIELVVDANVLVGELLRQRGRQMIRNPGLELSITEPALAEAQYELRRRVAARASQGNLDEATAENMMEETSRIIASEVALAVASTYAHLEAEARDRIPRDPDDWPTVAAALALNAAIWTQDYDFFGCGCPTWTSQTLLIQLRRQS